MRTLRAHGWQIMREHSLISTDSRRPFVDILAERFDDGTRALFEVKDFDSPVDDLAKSLGQFLLYQYAISHSGLELPIFLAVPEIAYQGILSEAIGRYARQVGNLKLMVFQPNDTEFIRWI
jgi:hypothetical protein